MFPRLEAAKSHHCRRFMWTQKSSTASTRPVRCCRVSNMLLSSHHITLQVDKPEQYGFHPDRLLLRMSELLLRLAEGVPFVAAVAEEPDYDEGILRRTRARLLQKQLGEYGVAARLDTLVQQASQTPHWTVAHAYRIA